MVRFFSDRLNSSHILQRINSPLGYVIFLLSGTCISFSIVYGGFVTGLLVLAAIIGLPFIYFIVAYPKFGIVTLLIASYLIMWVLRMGIDFPLGTLIDAIQLLLILGFFIKQKDNPNWKIFKNPITTIILIWISYNILQLFNPTTEVRLAWIYSIRSVAIVMLMYFIFVYNIRTKEDLRFILKLWIGLSLFAAMYALKQEYIGFFAFEEAYLNSSPKMRSLLFISGHWRRFSIFSDPVSFSYNMAVSSILCIILIMGPLKASKKIVLGIIAFLCLAAMVYSGTRGAYVLIPAAMIILVILKFNKQILIFATVVAVFLVFLVFVPTSNQTIYRFQSAFKPSDDASFIVRKLNQKKIQPFILSHPMGGGLGAVSATAKKISPNSYLSNFPPDSGYVRVAVELGWIGLFLFCTLFFVILKTGIKYYFIIKDPELKTYCLAMVLIVFAFHIGSYPQEAIVQFPASIYFYLVVALIPITLQIDKNELEKLK